MADPVGNTTVIAPRLKLTVEAVLIFIVNAESHLGHDLNSAVVVTAMTTFRIMISLHRVTPLTKP